MEICNTGASMAPQEAYSRLKSGAHAQDSIAIRALETLAAMTEEVDYRIVPTDTNGGKYQTRKWTRMVTEWQPHE